MSDNVSVGRQRCEPCAMYGDDENVSGFCVRCIEYLCKGCVKDHRKNKATRSHKVLDGEALPSDRGVYQRIQDLMKCTGHPEIVVEYKCENCDQFICSKCVAVNHRKCETIIDISTLPSIEQSNDELTFKLAEMKTVTSAAKAANESAIRYIGQQQERVEKETNKFLTDVLKTLNTLQDQVNFDTKQVADNEVSALKEDVKKCDELEKEMQSNELLLNAVGNVGDHEEMVVIPTLLKKTTKRFQSDITKVSNRKEMKIEFHKNQILTSIAELGKVVSKQTDRSLIQIFDKAKVDVSSDEVSGASAKTTIDQSPTKYPIKTPNDSHVCSISAIAVMPNGCIVVADKANKKLKVFWSNYQFNCEYSLDKTPTDMCLVKDKILALMFDNAKTVQCYEVADSIHRVNGFETGAYCSKIARYANKEQLIILVNTEMNGKGQKELQIRLVPNGKWIARIDDLPLNVFDGIVSSMHFFNNNLLFTSNGIVYCFKVLESKIEQEWFRVLGIGYITGLDTDCHGFIYASGKNSNLIVRYTERWREEHFAPVAVYYIIKGHVQLFGILCHSEPSDSI